MMGTSEPPSPLVAHLVNKVGTKDPPPPPPWWHIWWTKLELRTPLMAHLVDKVGTKDPPTPLVAHLVDKVGTKDPPSPPLSGGTSGGQSCFYGGLVRALIYALEKYSTFFERAWVLVWPCR